MEVQNRRDSPPLWLQLPASPTLIRRRPPASPIFEKSITLFILVPLLLGLVIFSTLSFASHSSQIIRNNIVKNGWDLLNVVLVVFAILCGVIGKLNDDETKVVKPGVAMDTSSVSDQILTNKETSIYAIFDDFDYIIKNPPTSQNMDSRLKLNGDESDDCNIKIIPVDTCVLGPAQSSTKPPLPPSNPAILRPRPTTPHQPRKTNNTNNSKKSGAGKEIATTIASLYKHAKSKTKHATTNTDQKNSTVTPPRTPVKPALPLPPTSAFLNMFRKATTTMRIHSEVKSHSSSLKSRVKSKVLDSKQPIPTKVKSECFKTVDVSGIRMAEAESEYAGSVLCPSPDVNVKADRFIARLKGEWKSDNMNS